MITKTYEWIIQPTVRPLRLRLAQARSRPKHNERKPMDCLSQERSMMRRICLAKPSRVNPHHLIRLAPHAPISLGSAPGTIPQPYNQLCGVESTDKHDAGVRPGGALREQRTSTGTLPPPLTFPSFPIADRIHARRSCNGCNPIRQ